MPTSTILSSRFLQLQSFKETTFGTGGVATAKWMALRDRPEFAPWQKLTIFDEQRGTLVPAYLSAILKKGGQFKIPGFATYEDILYLMYGGIQGGVTPTGVGPFVYAFAAPNAQAWNAQTFTLEWGELSNVAAVIANGCAINHWVIRGDVSGEWQYDIEGWYATHTQAGTLTPALADRTVEVILVPTTALYIDAGGGTIGTTAFANTLVTFNMDAKPNLLPVFTAGQLNPVGFTYDKVNVDLTLDLLYTSAVKTLVGNLFTGASELIRLKATSGAKIAQLDFAGVLTADPAMFPDKNKALTVQLKFSGQYDTGAFAGYLKSSVTNSVSTLP